VHKVVHREVRAELQICRTIKYLGVSYVSASCYVSESCLDFVESHDLSLEVEVGSAERLCVKLLWRQYCICTWCYSSCARVYLQLDHLSGKQNRYLAES
jgi:hypothetical protein